MKNYTGLSTNQVEKNVLHDLRITGEILRAARSKKDVLDFTIRIFLKLGFDRVRIWLIDEEKQELYGGASSHIPDHKFQKSRCSLNLKNISIDYLRNIKLKKPFADDTTLVLKKCFKDYHAIHSVDFPMFASKHPLGVIAVDNFYSGHPLNPTELEATIMPFVNHVSLALSRIISNQKLRAKNLELKKQFAAATIELKNKNKMLVHLAHHDELTGLPNRRDGDNRLISEFKKATPKTPLSVAMLDVDFFKQVNDTHGHLTGDRILSALGKVLQQSRSITYVYRYAGDEFIILITGKSPVQSQRLLENLRLRIKKKTIQTVSIGLASYPDAGIVTSLDLIRAADNALYHAKQTGRDRVVAFRDERANIRPLVEHKKALQRVGTRGTLASDYIGQLELVRKISENIQKAESVTDVIKEVLRIFRRQFCCHRVRVYRVNTEKRLLECIEAVGLQRSKFSGLNLPLNAKHSVGAEAVARKKVIDVPNTQQRKNFDPRTIKIFGTQAVLIIPLSVKQQVIGILIVDYDPSQIRFAENQHRFFLALGNHIALAIEQRQLLRETALLNRALTQKVKQSTRKLTQYSHSLEQKIEDNRCLRESERRTHFDIVSALVVSIESKDFYTRGHSVRVASYASKLGNAAGLSGQDLTNLRYASILHDLGKLSIDREILNKRSALDDTEVKQLAKHPEIGARIVSSIRFLKPVVNFIRHHHERWDGQGYPSGLKGKRIPLESRIINIVDAYDAMITRRSYGHKMTKQDAFEELTADAGRQFDPDLVKLFIQIVQPTKRKK